jgi:hypothetical protein
MDRVIQKILNDVCVKHDIDFKTAELVYMDMFGFIRQKLESIDFNKLNTEEDLRRARVNFSIPRIFKLYTTPSRIEYARKITDKKNSQHDKGISIDNNIEESNSITIGINPADGDRA